MLDAAWVRSHGLSLEGGLATLRTLANVPRTWPLARLTMPLSGFSKHLERLLEGYCMEVYATNVYPDEQLGSIKAFAKDLVLLLAFHLAERMRLCYARFWTTLPRCSMTLKTKCFSCASSGSSLSIESSSTRPHVTGQVETVN